MRVALWSPVVGRGWAAALRPYLERDVDLDVVGEEPRSVPAADIDMYHLDDDPAHGFVYRALFRRPGLVVLEEWGLHRLVRAETAGRGNEAEYIREARRSLGTTGEFVARQVLAGKGGALPGAFLAMNDRVLDAARGFVAPSEALQTRLAGRHRRRPLTRLPLAFQAPPPAAVPRRALEAPRVLGILPAAATTPPPRVARALDAVRASEPRTSVSWIREDDPSLDEGLAAADVVVALEHPSRVGLGHAVPRAVAAGRPVLVSAGSGAAREMPEGVVVRVSPGPSEVEETVTLVRRLVSDVRLRSRIGALARAHAAERRDPGRAARALLEVLRAAAPSRRNPERRPVPADAKGGSLGARALDEVSFAARDLGVVTLPADLSVLTTALFENTGS